MKGTVYPTYGELILFKIKGISGICLGIKFGETGRNKNIF